MFKQIHMHSELTKLIIIIIIIIIIKIIVKILLKTSVRYAK